MPWNIETFKIKQYSLKIHPYSSSAYYQVYFKKRKRHYDDLVPNLSINIKIYDSVQHIFQVYVLTIETENKLKSFSEWRGEFICLSVI